MGTKEKLVDLLKSLPADFTFDEAARLLNLFGYKKENKGKTSGSRVMFIDALYHELSMELFSEKLEVKGAPAQ